MAKMREVEADLMFAPRARNESQQCKIFFAARKSALNKKFRLRGGAVGPDAIFYGDKAALIFAERRVNHPVLCRHVTVNDGAIFFLNGAALENFSQFARDFGIFGD